jgi:two-component system sensor histidine kinase KdpD
MSRAQSDAWRLASGLAGVVLVTAIYAAWLGVTNTATVAATLLLVVLLVAATSSLWVAVVTSSAAVLVFNFFFMAPVGTFTIADPHNWVALAVFLAVSLVASHLSSVARARTAEALQRRDELARLFDLGRDVLVLTAGPEALSVLARAVARRFDLTFVAIAMPAGAEWRLHEAGTESLPLDRAELSRAMAAATTTLEFDAHTRTYAGQRAIRTPTGRDVSLVPLRVGTRPIGLLAAAGRPIEPGTLDALAGVVALAIERAQFLDERKTAELTRQSEELKTALLASLGHDLRTPLTAIRLAAANLKASWPTEAERAEQSDVILSEVERLTRLFGNVLEMARIDAGAVSADAQWVHVSEIIAAARDQVEHALAGHPVSLRVDETAIVRVDPRLTATTLAHLLENAAQYSPPGSPIDVAGEAAEGTLSLQVRDRGPGIPPADLPRLFDRFYRGSAAASRVSGTGMGLWIARELLAAERGRVWVENHQEGGAVFTLSVPAEVRVSAPDGSPTA